MYSWCGYHELFLWCYNVTSSNTDHVLQIWIIISLRRAHRTPFWRPVYNLPGCVDVPVISFWEIWGKAMLHIGPIANKSQGASPKNPCCHWCRKCTGSYSSLVLVREVSYTLNWLSANRWACTVTISTEDRCKKARTKIFPHTFRTVSQTCYHAA